jgi:hypothetical protein
MIDYSKLSGDKPNFHYDIAPLESEGYRFKAALDQKNPIFNEMIFEIKKANIKHKTINGNGNQKDIWVKEGK